MDYVDVRNVVLQCPEVAWQWQTPIRYSAVKRDFKKKIIWYVYEKVIIKMNSMSSVESTLKETPIGTEMKKDKF